MERGMRMLSGGFSAVSSSCFSLLVPRLVLLQAVNEKCKLVMDVSSFQASFLEALVKTRDEVVQRVGALSGPSRDEEVSRMVKDILAVMPQAARSEQYLVHWKMVAEDGQRKLDVADSNPVAVGAAVVIFSQAVDTHLLPFLHASTLASLLKGTIPEPQQSWLEFLVGTFFSDDRLAPIVGLDVRQLGQSIGRSTPALQPPPRQRQLLTLAFLSIKELISRASTPSHECDISTYSVQPASRTSTKTDYVFYATDRSDITAARRAGGVGSLDELSYGMVKVKIPVQQQGPGPVGEPTPENQVVITLRTSMEHNYKLFVDKTNAELNASSSVLVHVHGAITDFDESLERAAQVKHDLRLCGAVISYSWTSKSSAWSSTPLHYLQQYLSDEDSVERTVPYLANFIKLCITQVKGGTLHLVAHSMGNRALIGALQKLFTDCASECVGKGMPLRSVVLAAADAGLGRLQDMLKQAKAVYEKYHVTDKQKRVHFSVYCACDDLLLNVSQLLFPWHWGKPRVGLTYTHFRKDAITLAEDPRTGYLDVIDATGAETSGVKHHDYYHTVPVVLLDIQRLLAAAGKRRAFSRLPTPSEKWPTIYKVRDFYSFSPRVWEH